MAIEPKRLVIGCGLGCLAMVLILIGSCVGFNAWLRAPGELLEPRALLDPAAVGYVEGRLEPGNPGTEALVATIEQLMREQQPPVDSPVLRAIFAWNQGRQMRQMRRLLPARVVWTAYPGSNDSVDGASEPASWIASVSIQRAGHQLVLADWISGLILPRIEAVPLIEHRGERILVIRDEVEVRSDFSPAELELRIEAPEEPGELREAIGTTNERPVTFFTFLRRDGIFFANGASAVYRAIDRLTDGPSDQPPGRVEALLTALSSEHQVRGAILNDNRELLELLRASDEDSPELEALLSEVDSATVAGGFSSAGDGVLEIELRSRGPLPMRAELERLVGEHVAAAESDLELEWNVEDTSQGARIHLRIPDVAGQLHGWTERLRDQRSVEIDVEIDGEAVEADGEAVEIGVER